MADIGLDIGHDKFTFPPGKGVYKDGKGYAEHDFNSKLGIRIKELLEANGHKVILGQQPFGKAVGLTARTNLYNRKNVDLVVSIHANANSNRGVNGRCAFYWHTSKDGQKLAQSIINEIKGKGYSTHGNGLHESKIGSWTNLHITRETKAPAVLIEHGFMTGNKDFDLVFGKKQAEYIEDMAQADVAGIIKYLGGEPVKANATKSVKASGTASKGDAAKVVKMDTWKWAEVHEKPNFDSKVVNSKAKGSSVSVAKYAYGEKDKEGQSVWLLVDDGKPTRGYMHGNNFLPYRKNEIKLDHSHKN